MNQKMLNLNWHFFRITIFKMIKHPEKIVDRGTAGINYIKVFSGSIADLHKKFRTAIYSPFR